MTDRDDALRSDLGWTGPEETDFEPPADEPEPGPPLPGQVPPRPPGDYVPPPPPDTWEEDPGPTVEATRVADLPTEAGPPQVYREAERPRGSFRPPPPRYGPPPGAPRDTGPFPSQNRGDGTQWSQQPDRQRPRHGRPPMPPGQPPQQPGQPWPRADTPRTTAWHNHRAIHTQIGSGPTTSFRLDVFPRVGAGALHCSRPPSDW